MRTAGLISAAAILMLPAHADDLSALPPKGREAINNMAYLIVAKFECERDIGSMFDQYQARAVEHARLTMTQIGKALQAAVVEQRLVLARDKDAFCAGTKRNLPKFEADLATP